MLQKYLTEDFIQIFPNASDWRDAVSKSCQPLLDHQTIEPSYIKAIFRSHEKLGPYYVVGPGIAMPHARSEDGVNKLSIALTVIKSGVAFHSKENDPVKILLTLAATSSNSHINVIQHLAELFMNENDIKHICSADNTKQILDIIKKY